VYLSNAEKEALFLTGYGDVPPWAVQQGLEQALARGGYVPGEEALRLRLADALDLEERLMAVLIDDLETGLDPRVIPAGDEPAVDWETEEAAATEGAGAFTAEQIADYLAFPAGYEGHPDDHERMQLLRQLHNAKSTTEGQEAAEEPPADQWRSPLEIVAEGADEPVVDGGWVATDGEDAAPSAVHQEVEDLDLSTFTKLELVDYAFDMFGVRLKQSESKDRLIAHVQGLIDEANGAEV
jgi:hypothetical protein